MAAPGNEIDVALDELEKRLERLRSLYEQYFIGIERIEPSIPRQDVDRRIHALRKTQIRNTAKRFKLQNIIQRYNAFQQYWVRICREIENGTYHRHVARAQSRFGDVPMTAAARRRARLQVPTEQQREAAEQKSRARRAETRGDDAYPVKITIHSGVQIAYRQCREVHARSDGILSAGNSRIPVRSLICAYFPLKRHRNS